MKGGKKMEWNNKTIEKGGWVLLKNGLVVKVVRTLKTNVGYFYAHYNGENPWDYAMIVKKVQVIDA